MRSILVLAWILAMGSPLGQSQAQDQNEPLRVSLCEIKAHPEKFLHRLVEVTATASHGFEDSMFEDSRCAWPQGGPGVWMEYGGKRTTATTYCCGVSPMPTRNETLVVDGVRLELVDDEKFREFDKRLHSRPSNPRLSNVVRATLRGRIFARYEGLAGTKQDLQWRGYGHMDCCMLFVVTQVVSTDPPQ